MLWCGCLQDEGSITVRIMTKKPARITNPGSIFGILRNVLNRDASNYIGKIRMLMDQPEGNGACQPDSPSGCIGPPSMLQSCATPIQPAAYISALPLHHARGLKEGTVMHRANFLPAREPVKIFNHPCASASVSLRAIAVPPSPISFRDFHSRGCNCGMDCLSSRSFT